MKKVVSLMLVLVMVLGMATMASAAAPTYQKFKATTGATVAFSDQGSAVSDYYVGDVSVQNGNKEYKAQIDLSGFNTDGSTTGVSTVATATTGTLLQGEISKSNITIKTTVKKGAKAVDKVEFYDVIGSGKEAIRGIKLVLKDELQDISDGIEFDVRSYLVVDGRHYSANTLQWTGKLANDKSDKVINADYDYVYTGSGEIIIPDTYIKSIEMDLDKGVSVFGKMFKEKKYWAKANMDSYNDAEDEFMDKYDIDTVYHLKQVNVKAVANYVKLNDESSDLFVYGLNDGDATPVYLGKGDAKLDYYDTYYLADKEIDFGGDEEPVDEDPTDPAEVPGDLGGDDYYPENVNDNPGTGC